MTRYILDTGIAGLFLEREQGVFERAQAETLKGNRIGITGPILAELAFRAEGSPRKEHNLSRIKLALDSWKIWLMDTESAFQYGKIAFSLKTIGRPMGQNDITIAAIAITLGDAVIVTKDSDFNAIPNLSIEDWTASKS